MTSSNGAAVEPMAAFGAVRTGLLPHSRPLNPEAVDTLLALVPGRQVASRKRPVALAMSPAVSVGVDCKLAIPPRFVRGVGTVATSAVVVGGRILQSSARTLVAASAHDRRRPWSHYLSRAGVVEILSRLDDDSVTPPALAEGFLTEYAGAGTVDLPSVSERLMSTVRMSPLLDQGIPMRSGTTLMRWAAFVGDVSEPSVAFTLERDQRRTVRVAVGSERQLTAAQRFCEDLAVHDWLLTIAGDTLERAARFPSNSAESIGELIPLLEHLMHLWMPGAHTAEPLRPLWDQLETDPGFSRQWHALLGHVRDRIAIKALGYLHSTSRSIS